MGSRVRIPSGSFIYGDTMAKEKFSVENHILVPKHSKVTEKEKKEIFEKYHITGKELPVILKNDPALSNLDVKDGDIVKITRESPTAGKTYFYRRVSNA